MTPERVSGRVQVVCKKVNFTRHVARSQLAVGLYRHVGKDCGTCAHLRQEIPQGGAFRCRILGVGAHIQVETTPVGEENIG